MAEPSYDIKIEEILEKLDPLSRARWDVAHAQVVIDKLVADNAELRNAQAPTSPPNGDTRG